MKTLYVSSTAAGATAEYLRRHPELLDLQDSLRLDVYELALSIIDMVLDLVREACSSRVGIDETRLRSSEPDETARYAECRLLGLEVADRGAGIRYGSAALIGHTFNVVLYHEPSETTWQVDGVHSVDRPHVNPSAVRVVEARGVEKRG